MNTQEALKKLEEYKHSNFTGHWVGYYGAKELIEQLDHPQKVVIPQFVAEWIEDYKRDCITVYLGYNIAIGSMGNIRDWACTNPETFARAWLDGYEVEQEKLYTVEIPDPEKPNGKKTNLAKFKGKVFLSSTVGAAPLTEAEIKRNHEWAWQFAKEAKA